MDEHRPAGGPTDERIADEHVDGGAARPADANGTRILHEDHGLSDGWFVTLRVATSAGNGEVVYERSLGYGDGTAVIERLRDDGRSHGEALGAFWWGMARTAAAELAYELALPEGEPAPRFVKALRDAGGHRVLAVAQEERVPPTALERGAVLRVVESRTR